MIQVSSSIDPNTRGSGASEAHQALVGRLRQQAFDLERRFRMTESSVALLEYSLNSDNGIAAALNNTFEVFALENLQFQLFHQIVNDTVAGVLDETRDCGSIRAILRELRRDDEAIDALRSFYSDTTALNIVVTGDSLSKDDKQAEIDRTRAEFRDEQLKEVDELWDKIEKRSDILRSESAQRIRWVRNKLVSHFEQGEKGLITFEDMPIGDESMTWGEPGDYFNSVREYVYLVYLFLTRNSWDENFVQLSRFHAACFWERLKKGACDLEPSDFGL